MKTDPIRKIWRITTKNVMPVRRNESMPEKELLLGPTNQMMHGKEGEDSPAKNSRYLR